MRRPVRPLDPNDAPEYEADLDAYDKHQSDLEDMAREERISYEYGERDRNNNETENDNDNE